MDTGSTLTLLHDQLWEKFKEPQEVLNIWQGEPLYLANGEMAQPLGYKVLEYHMHGFQWTVPTVVLATNQLILGLDFICISGLQIDVKNLQYGFSVDKCRREYPFQPRLDQGVEGMNISEGGGNHLASA